MLLRRALGPEEARAIAATSSWTEGRNRLAGSIYGVNLPVDADRETARRVAMVVTIWQLRVLSGWLPPGGGGLVRLAAAPIEIANIENHLARIQGGARSEPVPMGALGVAWPRLAGSVSPEQVRRNLSRSGWGDPGGADRFSVALGLRVAWVRRVVRAQPAAREWALGAVAGLVARELFVFGRQINDVTGQELDRLLGREWRVATTVLDFTERLPAIAQWSLRNIDSPADVWHVETRIVQRVIGDVEHRLVSSRHDRDGMADILSMLLVDLWRVMAAIEASGRGPSAVEVLDAVA
jgi:hypothetical protein